MTPRSGRRPGASTTRDEIVRAARELFGEHGFEVTTVRAIGRRAGVDAALVHHFFSTKASLFAAAVADVVVSGDPVTRALDGPVHGAGERLVLAFLLRWELDEDGPALLAIVRSAAINADAMAALGVCIGGHLAAGLADIVDGDPGDAALRAELIGSHLLGIAMLRYVVPIGPIAALAADDVAALVGPGVQRYLTEPVPVGVAAAAGPASRVRSVARTKPGSWVKK